MTETLAGRVAHIAKRLEDMGVDPAKGTIPTLLQASKMLERLTFSPCPGCDGHECDWVEGVCAYPGALTAGKSQP